MIVSKSNKKRVMVLYTIFTKALEAWNVTYHTKTALDYLRVVPYQQTSWHPHWCPVVVCAKMVLKSCVTAPSYMRYVFATTNWTCHTMLINSMVRLIMAWIGTPTLGCRCWPLIALYAFLHLQHNDSHLLPCRRVSAVTLQHFVSMSSPYAPYGNYVDEFMCPLWVFGPWGCEPLSLYDDTQQKGFSANREVLLYVDTKISIEDASYFKIHVLEWPMLCPMFPPSPSH